MSEIQRFGESARWSDVVIYRGETGTRIFCGNGDFRSGERLAFTRGVSDVMLYAADVVFAGWTHALGTLSKRWSCIGVQGIEDETGKTVVKVEA